MCNALWLPFITLQEIGIYLKKTLKASEQEREDISGALPPIPAGGNDFPQPPHQE